MVHEDEFNRNREHILATMESCKTLEQLRVAYEWAKSYIERNNVNSLAKEFSMLYYKKLFDICPT